VRGTPGQSVELSLADDWRLVSGEARIPLTPQWQDHSLQFEIRSAAQSGTTLAFRLPQVANGTFDLANTRLKLAK